MALAADAGLLAPLCAEHAAYEGIGRDDDAGFVERLSTALAAARLHAWLAVDAGGVLGYVSLTFDFSSLNARPFAHLDCLYLREAARGRGLGARLLACVRRFAAERGCAELQWQTPAWNAAAVRFYLREGASVLDKKRFSCPTRFTCSADTAPPPRTARW